MPRMRCVTSSPVPYVDGNQVLFEVSDEGSQVECAISRLALELVVGGRCFRPADLLAGFRKAQAQIENFAIRKFHARPEGMSGRVRLWADDVDDPPMGGVPTVSCSVAAQLPGG